jgi:hypothetical protein
MKRIFFLIGILFSIIGCVEDPEEFGYADIHPDSFGSILISIADKDSSYVETNFSGSFPSIKSMEGLSSIEFIRTDSTDSVIYYHQDINFDNYQKYYDRTPFRVENWEKISKYKYIYHIKASDFD